MAPGFKPVASRNTAGLPATAGKTTVPQRTVAPTPPVKTKAAPKRPVSQTPLQAANAQVGKMLAPQYTQLSQQATGQNAAIANLTKAVIAALGGLPASVAGDYNQAIGQQTNLSNAAADSLRAANPNTQDQALLSAINAPDAQKAQLAGQNNAAFNGGAAVGQYVGGVLPMDSLQAQKLAAVGLARNVPVIEGLRGQQALSSALAQQADARAKVAAQSPALVQNWLNAYHTAQNQNKQLSIEQRKLGYFDATKSKGLGYQVDSTGSPIRDATGKLQVLPGFKQLPNGQIAKAYAPKSAKTPSANSALSGKFGYLVDGQGAPIFRGGKLVLLPGSRIVNGRVVTKGSGSKGGPRLTALQVQKFRGEAETIVSNAKSGFQGKDPVTGKPKSFPPLTLAGAWEELRKHGVPETIALRVLQRIYKVQDNGVAIGANVNPAKNSKAAGPKAP